MLSRVREAGQAGVTAHCAEHFGHHGAVCMGAAAGPAQKAAPLCSAVRVAAAGAAATSGAACSEPAPLRAAKTGTGALRACWGQRQTPGTRSSQHASACSYTDVKRLIGLGCTWLHYIFNGNVDSRSHGSSDFYTTVIIFKLCFRHC